MVHNSIEAELERCRKGDEEIERMVSRIAQMLEELSQRRSSCVTENNQECVVVKTPITHSGSGADMKDDAEKQYDALLEIVNGSDSDNFHAGVTEDSSVDGKKRRVIAPEIFPLETPRASRGLLLTASCLKQPFEGTKLAAISNCEIVKDWRFSRGNQKISRQNKCNSR